MDHMHPRMAMSAAQHKIINLIKTLWDFFFVITCHNVFIVWPKTILFLPKWPRDAKRLDTPGKPICICRKYYPYTWTGRAPVRASHGKSSDAVECVPENALSPLWCLEQSEALSLCQRHRTETRSWPILVPVTAVTSTKFLKSLVARSILLPPGPRSCLVHQNDLATKVPID